MTDNMTRAKQRLFEDEHREILDLIRAKFSLWYQNKHRAEIMAALKRMDEEKQRGDYRAFRKEGNIILKGIFRSVIEELELQSGCSLKNVISELEDAANGQKI